MPRIPFPTPNKEVQAKNTKEQYEALGRFVEAFELLVDEVRGTCVDRVWEAVTNDTGLAYEFDSHYRKGLIEIPFHNQNMTAKPLWDIMRAIIADILSQPNHPSHTERSHFKSLLGFMESEYSSLYNKRNALLHGTWQIGYGSPDDVNSEKVRIKKMQTTADGLTEVKELPQYVTELSSLTDRCDNLRNWIAEINFCLWKNRPLGDHFKKDGGVWLYRLQTSSATWTTFPKKPA